MTNPNNFQPDTDDALNDAMYPRLEGETEEAYNARIADMQAKIDAWQNMGQESEAEEAPEEAVEEVPEEEVSDVEESVEEELSDEANDIESEEPKIVEEANDGA